MRQPPDPYRELGVPRGASEDQIKAAHRRLAKRYHPDASSGERERFLAIQEAYLLLTDPIRRREWDARHAPGPVRASPGPTHGAPMARSRRGTQPRPDVTGTTARTSRGTTRGTAASARTAASPPREPGTQAYTWSAAGVPWWEDFQPKGGSGAGPNGTGSGPASSPGNVPGAPQGGAPAGSETPHHDPDPSVRSSGTAWSSAARRYFRQGDADLPRGGQFRYRGTQVVTGTEARRVADEELRRRQAQAQRAAARPAGTQPGGTQPGGTQPGGTQPASAARGAGSRPEQGGPTGFVARLRRLLGG
jgi:curved DNA-binding protein CbpA